MKKFTPAASPMKDALKKQIAEQESIIQSKDQQITSLQNQLSSQSQALANAQNASSNAGSNLAAKILENNNLRSELSSLQSTNNNLSTQLESKNREIIGLKAQISTLEEQERPEAVNAPREDMQALTTANIELKAEITQKTMMIEMLMKNLDELRSDKDDLKNDKQFLQNQTMQMHASMVKKDTEIDLLKSQLDNINLDGNPFALDAVHTTHSEFAYSQEIEVSGSFSLIDQEEAQ